MDYMNGAFAAATIQTFLFWGAVIILVLGCVLGPRYIRSRERQRLYELMRTAYEKGQTVPPEVIAQLSAEPQLDAAPRQSGSGSADPDLRRAVVLIAVGIGLAGLGLGLGWGIGTVSAIGGTITGGIIAGCGAIPGFIGVAYLLLWLVSRNHPTPKA